MDRLNEQANAMQLNNGKLRIKLLNLKIINFKLKLSDNLYN
jgi:hypothetical protein